MLDYLLVLAHQPFVEKQWVTGSDGSLVPHVEKVANIRVRNRVVIWGIGDYDVVFSLAILTGRAENDLATPG